MITIEERAEILATYHHYYFSESLKDDIVHALKEQDKIARKEERERCIKLAQECVRENWKDWLISVDKDGVIKFQVDDKQIRECLTNDDE